MTNDEQVALIIQIMTPEDPTTTDAVFLVQRYMRNAEFLIQAKNKQIAMLEAMVEDFKIRRRAELNESIEIHEVENGDK